MIGAGPTLALLLALAAARPLGDGFEFLKQGKPTFARTAFQNAAKKSPDDPRIKTGLGLTELALGNADGACALLLEAIEKDKEFAPGRVGLARAFLLRARSRIAVGRGDEEETRYFVLDAQTQAEKAAALDPKSPDPWVVIAEAQLELGDFERAERAIADAAQRGLDKKLLRQVRGELSFAVVRARAGGDDGGDAASKQASYDEAKAALDALIRDDPGSAELKLRLGELNDLFGKWDAALDAWQKAFAIEPYDRPTLERLLAYVRAPELRTKARAVLDTAWQRAQALAQGGDPRPGFALFCVAQAKLMDRELEAAADLFKKAQVIDPTLAVECSLGMGDCDFRAQRYDGAAAAWKAAFKADAAAAKALLVHLGTATSVSGALQFIAGKAREGNKNDEARDLLGIAWQLEPDTAGVCNDYALLCRDTGKIEQSWEAYSHLIELAPEQPRYLNDAALVLHQYVKKDLLLARSLYERAIAAADALIGDAATPTVTKDMARDAKKDAANNLALLDRETKH